MHKHNVNKNEGIYSFFRTALYELLFVNCEHLEYDLWSFQIFSVTIFTLAEFTILLNLFIVHMFVYLLLICPNIL